MRRTPCTILFEKIHALCLGLRPWPFGAGLPRFYQGACLTDLGQKMLSSDMGIHSAAMGGIWQNVVLGFGGVRLVGGSCRFLPLSAWKRWSRLEFPLVFRGTPLRVAAERNRVVVENRGTVPVALRLCGKELELAAGSRYEVGL